MRLRRDRGPAATLAASRSAGLAEIQVSPTQGQLRALLARAIGARRILEVGTLGGDSTLWRARALPRGGRRVTIEAEPRHAAVARRNLARARLDAQVEVLVGRAEELLPRLAAEDAPPFDLVFLDSEKTPYLEPFVALRHRLRAGGLLIADNVVRGGAVARPGRGDPKVEGVRRLLAAVGRDPTLSATVVQTVGAKGHDGMPLAVARGPSGATRRRVAPTRARVSGSRPRIGSR